MSEFRHWGILSVFIIHDVQKHSIWSILCMILFKFETKIFSFSCFFVCVKKSGFVSIVSERLTNLNVLPARSFFSVFCCYAHVINMKVIKLNALWLELCPRQMPNYHIFHKHSLNTTNKKWWKDDEKNEEIRMDGGDKLWHLSIEKLFS